MTEKKEHKYLIRKCRPIQFRLTQEQWEKLQNTSKLYGDRPNNVARTIFLNGLRKEPDAC